MRRSPAAILAFALATGFASAAAAGELEDPTAIRGGFDEEGSLLVLPQVELRWNAAGFLIQDTFLSVLNDFPSDVTLRVFYVNGDPPLDADPPERAHPGWNSVDMEMTLTGEHPTYWSAASGLPGPVPLLPLTILDPGFPPGRPDPDGSSERVLRAFVYVFAAGPGDHQINWNHLSGHATVVDYTNQTASEYAAVAYPAFGTHGAPVGTAGEIRLDGTEFEACYDRLFLDFQAVGSGAFTGPVATTSGTDLTLQVVPADLGQTSVGPVTTKAVFEIWNQNEVKFTGTELCITCWNQTRLDDYAAPNSFPLLVLQTDHGWARIDGRASLICDGPDVTSVDAPLLGVSTRVLDFGTGTATAASAVGLRGDGLDTSAVVRYDPLGPPPPLDGARAHDGPAAPGASSAGPGTVRVSTGEGSLLVLPNVEVRWDQSLFLIQDTFITLQNHAAAPVLVKMFFVNGDPPLDANPPEPAHPGWNFIDNTILLTNSQPVYWSALTGLPMGVSPFTTLDPGFPPGRPDPAGTSDRVLRGMLYVWAINGDDEEIKWNQLSGGATVVHYQKATAWEHRAYASAAVDPLVAQGDPTGTPGVLELDGTKYAPGYDQLLLDFQAAGGDAFSGPLTVIADTDLTLHPLSMDLRQESEGPVTTKAGFDVWNMNEVKFSGTHRCVTCWDQTLLSDYDVPNQFLVSSLQTDRGKARIDGQMSVLCDFDFDPNDGALGCHPLDRISANAALLGISTTLLSFEPNLGEDTVGSTLVGMGTQMATVRYDTLGPPPPFAGGCPEDLNGNGQVDFADILAVIGAWGPCCCPEDLDGSGDVGFSDILLIIGAWGPC
ncbi:MAG: hypothetical protein GY715_18285 [Planctomycetes bacterium]|nr:hypothetical protein [Planctomycetota bacterium]